jgi:hypothetical protein
MKNLTEILRSFENRIKNSSTRKPIRTCTSDPSDQWLDRFQETFKVLTEGKAPMVNPSCDDVRMFHCLGMTSIDAAILMALLWETEDEK